MLTRSKTKRTRERVQCLPLDVLQDILQRLPLKSLTRLKLTCKQWNSLISDPRFLHRYKTARSGETHIIISTYSNWKPFVNIYSLQGNHLTKHEVESQLVPLQQPMNSWSSICPPLILGSYNGLLALLYSRKKFILWNPLTQDQICLTYEFVPFTRYYYNCFHGLCYNKTRDEYIALVALYHKLLLLNFQTKDCKTLHQYNVLLDARVSGNLEGVVICGVPHWVVQTKDLQNATLYNLVYFDLETEKFMQLSWPNHGQRRIFGLGALNGQSQLSLLVYQHHRPGFEVWVKNESKLWTRLFKVPYLHNVRKSLGYVDLLGFTATGELLINANYKRLWCIDPKTGKSRKIKLPFRGRVRKQITFTYEPRLTSVSFGET